MWRFNHLAENEQDQVSLVEKHVERLISYAEDFAAALSLFNFCIGFPRDLTGRWAFVAARDGAMTIYHIGKTVELTRAALKGTPTLDGLVDLDVLKEAGKKYRANFPTFEKIRHAVSHSSELFRDKKNAEHNAAQGFVGMGIHAPNVKNFVISNSLINRNYTNTIDGKVVSYEISEATKAVVYDCVNTFVSGFSTIYRHHAFPTEVPAPRW